MLKPAGAIVAKACLGFCLLALALTVGCGGDQNGQEWPTGAVKFHLDLPDGQKVDKVDLKLVCPAAGVDITSTLNVVNRNIVAVFGGLTPGACTVTISTKTDKGVECAGTQAFTVVAKTTVDVRVTLACQGINYDGAGTARIKAVLETKDCSADRIKLIEAVPGDLLLGESTKVQVKLHEANVVGTPTLKFSLRNEATQTAQGTFSDAGTCAAGAAGCRAFTCTGLGASTTTDPETGFPAAGAFISVEYEDDNCFDTEEVWIACLQSGTCGDGVKNGVEECDDANNTNNDGCSATCKTERCGDGVKNGTEECDGLDGVTTGKACNNTTCKLEDVVVPPVCGDGKKNQASEECDGSAGLQPNQVCGNDCKIMAVCGNGIVEGTEQCDNPNDASCVNCTTQTAPTCGDGVKNGTEECDGTDGVTAGKTCNAQCKLVDVTVPPTCGDGVKNQTSEECDGNSGLQTGQQCGTDCKIVPVCGNGIIEGPEQCDTTAATCVNCRTATQGNACNECIAGLADIGPFYNDNCKNDPLCDAALKCVLDNKSCWGTIASAACFCGDSQADIDACEQPTFTPKGRCATAFKAGAGANATNQEVLQRYFDPAYPVGSATIVADGAFTSDCKARCF